MRGKPQIGADAAMAPANVLGYFILAQLASAREETAPEGAAPTCYDSLVRTWHAATLEASP